MRPPPSAAYASLVIVVAAVCLGCSVSTVKGTPSPAPSTSATGGSVSLSGWQLTLPLAGKNGAATIVNPAAASPPWLSTDDSGGLAFFAPVDGAKLTLLSEVALGARFDYSLADNGDGSLTFTADDGAQHASMNAPCLMRSAAPPSVSRRVPTNKDWQVRERRQTMGPD